jgi:hypothetical protein
MRAGVADRPPSVNPVLLCAAAWAIPGAGHFWLGRRQKAALVCLALVAMFVIGLAIEGCLFPLVLSEPFVGLSGLADLGVGLPYIVARAAGLGAGDPRAATYEYGNTFLIVAGLLNVLVILDAYDIATGRK